MKIQNESLQALLLQQETSSRTAVSADFESALSSEMTHGETKAQAMTLPPPGAGQAAIIGSMLLNNDSTDNGAVSMAEVFSQASGALDLWDEYVSRLGSGSQDSLRSAYTLLEGLDRQVNALRKNANSIAGQNQGLDNLVNELAIMTTTETFKFNRGDYMA